MKLLLIFFTAVAADKGRDFVHPIGTNTFNFKFEPFRYGNYCGQGPEESLFHLLSPIDAIDELCRVHDLEYQHCFGDLMTRAGFEIPTLLHQFVAVRGLFPLPLLQSISHYAPEYIHCTHLADQKFVSASRNILTHADDLKGDCSIGTESSCLVSAKTLFMYMIEIFESGLQLDEVMFQLNGTTVVTVAA